MRLVRADGVYQFPADFQLVAAANPCPCGHLGDPGHECRCTPAAVDSYLGKVGGPLMDRIDMQIDVARPTSRLVVEGSRGTGSAAMREQARTIADLSEREHVIEDDVMEACGFRTRMPS